MRTHNEIRSLQVLRLIQNVCEHARVCARLLVFVRKTGREGACVSACMFIRCELAVQNIFCFHSSYIILTCITFLSHFHH